VGSREFKTNRDTGALQKTFRKAEGGQSFLRTGPSSRAGHLAEGVEQKSTHCRNEVKSGGRKGKNLGVGKLKDLREAPNQPGRTNLGGSSKVNPRGRCRMALHLYPSLKRQQTPNEKTGKIRSIFRGKVRGAEAGYKIRTRTPLDRGTQLVGREGGVAQVSTRPDQLHLLSEMEVAVKVVREGGGSSLGDNQKKQPVKKNNTRPEHSGQPKKMGCSGEPGRTK